MADIGGDVSVFGLVRDDEVAGYVALRQMEYLRVRRRGLRRVRWATDEVEGNFFLLREGRPTGFGVVTEMVEEIANGAIHYRGRRYGLVPVEEPERHEVWQAHLSDEPD